MAAAEPSLETSRVLKGNHYFVVDETIDLATLSSELESLQNQGVPPRYLHILCDTLEFNGQISDGKAVFDLQRLLVPLVYVHIYARSLLADQGIETLYAQGVESIAFRLYFETCPPGLQLALGSNQCYISGNEALPTSILLQATDEEDKKAAAEVFENKVKLMADQYRSLGREITFTGSAVSHRTLQNILTTEIDREHVGPFVRMLLNNLFLSASLEVYKSPRNTSKLTSTYRFIASCARHSSTLPKLAEDAQTLLDKIEAPYRYPGVLSSDWNCFRLDVPNQSSKTLLDQLERDIGNLKLLQNDYEQTSTSIKDRAFLLQNIDTVLSAVALTVKEYSLKTLRDDAESAVRDMMQKQIDLKDANIEVEYASSNFKTGTDAYVEKKKAEFKKEMLKAGLEIGGSIAIAIVTAGAGAPATAATVYNAASKAIKGVELVVTTWDKVKVVLKKIADLILKLGPKMYAAYNDKENNLSASAKGKESGTKLRADANEVVAASSTQTVAEPLDYLGLMADWEELRLLIDDFFQELSLELGGEDKVGGFREYRMALRKLCIRGQTALNAQKKAHEDMRKYQSAVSRAAERKERAKTITSAGSKVMDAEAKAAKYKAAVMDDYDRQITLGKRQVFLSFYDCCSSVMYENSLRKYPDLGLHSNMNHREFLKAHSSLSDEKIDAAKHRGESYDLAEVLLDTSNEKSLIFPADWHSLLVSERKLYFDIGAHLAQMNRYYRIRVKGVRVRFQGLKQLVKTKEDGPKDPFYTVYFGPQFIDRTEREDTIQYTMEPIFRTDSLVAKPREAPWLSTSTDGMWKATETGYAKPALFCKGYIAFDRKTASEVDLSSIQRCQISLNCEGNALRLD